MPIQNEAQNRMLGSFYRVKFFGEGFDELDGHEFIYKEPKITRLGEITERLMVCCPLSASHPPFPCFPFTLLSRSLLSPSSPAAIAIRHSLERGSEKTESDCGPLNVR